MRQRFPSAAANRARLIVRSFDVFGEHGLISIWAREPYHDENPQAREALAANIDRATKLIGDDPAATARILAGVSKLDPADEERLLTEENITYINVPHGFITFAEFMQSAGLINRVPAPGRTSST